MPKPKTGRNGEPKTVYLNKEICQMGQDMADNVYRISFSDLIEKLLKKDHARLARKSRRVA